MTAKRSRANGEGSIFPYRNGYAAYAWVTKPDGKRTRKYVYGKTREEVHDKWIRLLGQAGAGPVATTVPTVGEYLTYWLREVIEPNVAPLTASTYETLVRLYIAPGIGNKRLDRLQARDVQEWINRSAASANVVNRVRTQLDQRGGSDVAPSGGAVAACCRLELWRTYGLFFALPLVTPRRRT